MKLGAVLLLAFLVALFAMAAIPTTDIHNVGRLSAHAARGR